jgi:outer membrane protein OmpA-like peptidoglycan-associated protein
MTWTIKEIILTVSLAVLVSSGIVYVYLNYFKEYEVIKRLEPAENNQKMDLFVQLPVAQKWAQRAEDVRAEQQQGQQQQDISISTNEGEAKRPDLQASSKSLPDKIMQEAQSLLATLRRDTTVDLYRSEIGAKHKPPTLTFDTNIAAVDLDDIKKLIGEASLNCAIIIIIGHADSIWHDDYNMRLSERRAEAAKNRLFELQEADSLCEGSEIYAIGKGEKVPAFGPYIDDLESKTNRRIEMLFFVTTFKSIPVI